MQKLFIFLLPGVFLLSCKKLSEHPQGSLTPENFYQTQSDAVATVTAVYSTLSTDINNDFPIYGRNLNLIVDNTSDNQVYSPSNTNPDVRRWAQPPMSAPINGFVKKNPSCIGGS